MMRYRKFPLHFILLFFTVAVGYSQEVIMCNKVTKGGFRISTAQAIKGRAHWNNWYYGNGGFRYGVISSNRPAQIMQSRLFTLSILQAHAKAEEARRKTASIVSGSSISSSQAASTSRRPIRKPSGNKLRTFTYNDGEEIQARLLSIDPRGSRAKIKTAKGLTYNVPVTQFSEDDLGYLRSWWEERNPRARHQFGKAVTGL